MLWRLVESPGAWSGGESWCGVFGFVSESSFRLVAASHVLVGFVSLHSMLSLRRGRAPGVRLLKTGLWLSWVVSLGAGVPSSFLYTVQRMMTGWAGSERELVECVNWVVPTWESVYVSVDVLVPVGAVLVVGVVAPSLLRLAFWGRLGLLRLEWLRLGASLSFAGFWSLQILPTLDALPSYEAFQVVFLLVDLRIIVSGAILLVFVFTSD